MVLSRKENKIMNYEEKIDEIYPYYEDMTDVETFQTASRRIGFIAGAEWKDKQYQELFEKSIEWFKDIADLCLRLTSGNVSHLGATIRGKAIRSAEFIDKHK